MWLKATSPPQELEVGGRRPQYLLVYHIVSLSMYVYYSCIYTSVPVPLSSCPPTSICI